MTVAVRGLCSYPVNSHLPLSIRYGAAREAGVYEVGTDVVRHPATQHTARGNLRVATTAAATGETFSTTLCDLLATSFFILH